MSGLEPLAGKAISAVGKSLTNNSEAQDTLLEVARDSGALEPAARLYAKRMAVRESVKLKFWQPLGQLFGISSDYFATQLEDDLARHFSHIPEENLTTPKLAIAGPAFEGIRYTADEPDLREMYLKLLATASDTTTADHAHPAFAEVIRQLSADEARALRVVLSVAPHYPLVEFRLELPPKEEGSSGGFQVVAHNVISTRVVTNALSEEPTSTQLRNWSRLGLVDLEYGVHLNDPQMYEWADTDERAAPYRTQYGDRLVNEKGLLRVTDFGRSFASV